MENNLLENIPQCSGVYFFYDINQRLLYIGKANNLKSRVSSYFQKSNSLDTAKRIMVSQVADIKYKETRNEAKALILETKLIKKHKPPYNIMMKDDKNFLYVKITEEDFPRVLFVRRPNFRDKAKFYGPFPWAKPVKLVYRYLHKIFPLRSCNNMPDKPCLEFHMGRCLAPCINGISKQQYTKIIDQVIKFFNGDTDSLLDITEQKMKVASKQKKYEKAAYYRDQIFAINKLKEIQLTSLQIQKRSEKEKVKKALLQIKQKLRLKKIPKRVEIYDISNIQGEMAVGSMVVFINGQPDKSEYRKFKIKTIQGANDTGMLQEVVLRRVKHDEWKKPDLVIMDGGKGQLNAVKDIWLDYKVSVVALAKKKEEIFIPNYKKSKKLLENSEGFYLIQRMRDEAHRFAIEYHRKLRLDKITKF
ncbi:MAG: excinuclease ABC subunit UvrC [Patescibacteria group bacterium]